MEVSVTTSSAGSHQGDVSSPGSSRIERVGYQTSPHAPNTPENNVCKLVTYRGAKVASFSVNGRELICLPQAFELFLKHLVGGLHTVYTKLKRLEIMPVVCNVEQVRILRGVAAIQPGVNRCKLISPQEFDVLYEDCTSSSARPGRPPKRSNFVPDMPPDTTPSKIRKSNDTNIFQFDDIKSLSTPGAGFMPPFQGYPSSLPSLPFVSPYQLNLMHQAAVQMAFANQIQSNLARATETTACMTQGLMKPVPLINPIRHVATESNTDHRPTYPPTEKPQESSTSENCKERDEFTRRTATPVSVTSDIPVSQSNKAIVHQLSPHNVMPPTPPLSSPRETEPEMTSQHPLVINRSQSYQHATQDSHKLTSRSLSEGEDDYHQQQIATIDQSEETLRSPDTSSLQPTYDGRSLDDILLNVKSEIKSFIESVLQHQEEIITDIEALRNALRQKEYNQRIYEKIAHEEQNTKSLIESQLDRDREQREHLERLLKITKSDLHHQWWNRNPHV